MERRVFDAAPQTAGSAKDDTAANRAALLSLPGITPAYVQLLEAAGVDTIKELQRRLPENLFTRMMEAAHRHQVETPPRLDVVRSWVAHAKRVCQRSSEIADIWKLSAGPHDAVTG